MAPVWTRWAATAAPACRASWASAVRATSTSACPTPVTPAARRTACSVSMTSTASVVPATPVGAQVWRAGAGGTLGRQGETFMAIPLAPRAPLRIGRQRLQREAMQEWGHLCRGLQHSPRVHLQMSGGRFGCWGAAGWRLPRPRALRGPRGLPGLKVAAEGYLRLGPGPVHVPAGGLHHPHVP